MTTPTRADLCQIVMGSKLSPTIRGAVLVAINAMPASQFERVSGIAARGLELLKAQDVTGFSEFVREVARAEGAPAPLVELLLSHVQSAAIAKAD